jgi:1,4-dihydroxy-2-naphthoate octaprenyltransferase
MKNIGLVVGSLLSGALGLIVSIFYVFVANYIGKIPLGEIRK